MALTARAQVQTLDPLTVSATRAPEPQSEVPFSVEVVPGEALDDTFSATVDDALRSSADFSLFRRNDSMTANPTSQGVSLRGLGPSRGQPLARPSRRGAAKRPLRRLGSVEPRAGRVP